MENEISEPKDILPIIQQYIEKKIDEGVDERISELNEPDGAIIWECMVRAFNKAEIPHSKWAAIREYVEKSMHEEGWKFILQ